jgi:hypothetical protein
MPQASESGINPNNPDPICGENPQGQGRRLLDCACRSITSPGEHSGEEVWYAIHFGCNPNILAGNARFSDCSTDLFLVLEKLSWEKITEQEGYTL